MQESQPGAESQMLDRPRIQDDALTSLVKRAHPSPLIIVPGPQPGRGRRWITIIAPLLLVIILGGVAFALFRPRSRQPLLYIIAIMIGCIRCVCREIGRLWSVFVMLKPGSQKIGP